MARYKMRQKMFSFGEDFSIEDEQGRHAFEVDGKVMTLRETFELKDPSGKVVATIRGKLLSVRAKMEIERGGDLAATITKKLFAPLGDKFSIDLAGGGELSLKGDLLDHEYTLRRDGEPIATVSKRWFSFTDTYGIEVAPGEDDALVLAIAVALDEMAHDKDEGRG